MMKKLLFGLILLGGTSALGQNVPTIESSNIIDTLCTSGNQKLFMTVTVKDLDADSTYITNVGADLGYIDAQWITIVSPAYVPGDTLRTFEFYGNSLFSAPAGFSTDNLLFDLVGDTIADGGDGFDGVGNIPLYGEVTADVTTTNINFCDNANPVDLSQYEVNSGGEFHWEGGIGQWNVSNTFDPQLAMPVFDYNGGEYAISYYYYNQAGCYGYTDIWVYYDFSPLASVVETPSTCQNADGAATVSVSSGTAPYDVYWTTGLSETISATSTVNNLSSGVYYANITDANGCKTVGKAEIYDSDLSVTPAVTASYCEGQPGQVDLTINPQVGTVDEIFWSNGSTSSTISAAPGEYAVEIHTTGNCQFFGTYEIPDSALDVSVVGTGDNFDCISTPSGYVDITTSGGQGGYTWDWTKNGTAFATTEDLSAIQGGVYKCTVTDGSGCSLTWATDIENYNNVWLYVDQVTKATCGQNNGAIDIMIDSGGDTPTTYEWSTGATTEDLTGVDAGTYTLTYADQSGCENYLTVKVPYEKPYQPEICLLTVDTSYTYNQVIWEKIPSNPVAGFNIYRETSNFGQFEKVAERPYALESTFIDNAASPVDRSWRYYITTYDNCGNESFPSFVHKTIHIVANTTNGTDYDVHWDNYEGISYTDVDLYRFDDVSNDWTLVGNFPYGTLSHSETPAETSGIDYIVSFNLTAPCTATKAQDYNSSRSNNSSALFAGGGSTNSIEDEDLGRITFYPNPTEGVVNVFVEDLNAFEHLVLMDASGKVIKTIQITSGMTTIDLSELSKGMYFATLVGDSKTFNQKLIKR